jgi:hypothetical protein
MKFLIAVAPLLIVISIACSASKSAAPPAPNANTAPAQTVDQPDQSGPGKARLYDDRIGGAGH